MTLDLTALAPQPALLAKQMRRSNHRVGWACEVLISEFGRQQRPNPNVDLNVRPGRKAPQTAKAFLGKIKNLSPNERADRAIGLAEQIIDLVGLVVSAHATNQIVNYSDCISSQVGRSYAANTFNNLRHALFETEILRLVRLWDAPDLDRISIPTTYWLTNDADVKTVLNARNTAFRDEYPGYLEECVARQERLWRRFDRITPRTMESDLLKRLRNFRDKRVARLVPPVQGRKEWGVEPAVYGDERRLLDCTIVVTHVLGMAARAADFDFKGQWKIAERNAEAFWHGCTVKPLR